MDEELIPDDLTPELCPEKRLKLSEEDGGNIKTQCTPKPCLEKKEEVEGNGIKTQSTTGRSFEAPPLPEGWITVRHGSGINLYLHKSTRTLTLSRPYTIPESKAIKKHRVPVDAIPCLKQWLFCEDKTQLALDWHKATERQFGQLVKIEPQRLEEYVKLRWPVGGMSDLNSQGAASHASPGDTERRRKVPRKKEPVDKKPSIPENISKLTDINVQKCYRIRGTNGKTSPGTWSVDTMKGAVSLLYEFCEHYLRADLEFVSKETDNVQSPFYCTAVIGGTQYGHGYGSSKKIAKRAAANATLHLFLPHFTTQLSSSHKSVKDEKYKFLSTVNVCDPKAADILAQAGLASPWSILRECCQRNKGSGRVGEPVLNIELKPVTESNLDLTAVSDPLEITPDPYSHSLDISGTLDEFDKESSKLLSDDPRASIETSIDFESNLLGYSDAPPTSTQTTPSSIQAPPTHGKEDYQSWYYLKCGDELEVSGPCSGKKTGQQLAAQAMLKLIYPHIHTWDSLIKLYGDTQSSCPRVFEEKTVDNLSKLSQNDNSELLEQLRKEMRKLSERET